MFATVEDVRKRYNGQTLNDDYLSAVVDDANAVLNTRVPDLAARVANEPTLGDVAKAVVCAAIIRYIANPFDVMQQTMGSYNISYGRDRTMFYRDDELELLKDSNDVVDIPRSVRVTSPFMR